MKVTNIITSKKPQNLPNIIITVRMYVVVFIWFLSDFFSYFVSI